MKTFDRKRLIELAGARAFRRGEEYFAWRRVRALAVDGAKITAFVYGGRRYRVAITVDGEETGYECDCPEGASARFCKHCVAVGLNWLEGGANGGSSSATWQDVRDYLANSPPEELAQLALDEAARSAEFRERLWLRATRAGGKQPDWGEYRRRKSLAGDVARRLIALLRKNSERLANTSTCRALEIECWKEKSTDSGSRRPPGRKQRLLVLQAREGSSLIGRSSVEKRLMRKAANPFPGLSFQLN